MSAKPFVTWVGGKRKLIEQIVPRFPDRIRTYHEPFLGGGAIFFEVQRKMDGSGFFGERIDRFSLSDINAELISSYLVLRDHLDETIDRLKEYKRRHCREAYYAERDRRPIDLKDMGARFIYLMNVCYNGKYQVAADGRFTTSYGKETYINLILKKDRLKAVSEALQGVDINRMGFEDIRPRSGDLVYCDPPYYETSDDYSYEGFGLEGQQRLAAKAEEWLAAGAVVILSNSDNEVIRSLYPSDRWDHNEITAPRGLAAGFRKTTELLMTPRSLDFQNRAVL